MNGSRVSQPSAAFVVVGDVMVDTIVIIDGPLSAGVDHLVTTMRHVGGQAANTAAWLAWSGMQVHLVAVCGDDDDGEWVDAQLGAIGVRTHMPRASGPTGSCIVVVDSTGERTMFSSPGTNRGIADIGPGELASLWTVPGFSQITHLHLSGYLLDRDPDLVAVLAGHAPEHASVSIDAAAFRPNDAHRRSLLDSIAHLDVLIGTAEELAALLDPHPGDPTDVTALAHRWRDRFAGLVVVKQGAAGASALAAGELLHEPALPADVVDTTGAGDAFTAGFLAAWALDRTAIREALRSGTEAAAQAVSRIGANPPAQEGR